MTYSINKQQFLLSLFLLLPATTHSMKITDTIAITSQPKTVQELVYNRDQLIFDIEEYYSTKLTIDRLPNHRPKNRIVLQPIQEFVTGYLTYNESGHDLFLSGCTNLTLLSTYKQYRHNYQYSFLGVSTVAVKDLASEKLSYSEKKDFIQKLLALGFQPTPYDKEIAIVELWERWQPIIEKIWLFRSASNDPTLFLSEAPRDVINYIELCMLGTEEPLF